MEKRRRFFSRLLTSEVIVPILIKIPRANNIPPATKSNTARPIAFQGTILQMCTKGISSFLQSSCFAL